MSKKISILHLLLGHFFVALAFIGIFLPLLPTTPFLILAAYFYQRGNPKFVLWMRKHPLLGPPLVDWQDNKVIRPKAKMLAIGLLMATLAYPVFFKDLHIGIKIIACITGISVTIFILTRNSSQPLNTDKE